MSLPRLKRLALRLGWGVGWTLTGLAVTILLVSTGAVLFAVFAR
ncbi:hypothetical protein [Brevundimonas sp.]|jgi:hypothetical protein